MLDSGKKDTRSVSEWKLTKAVNPTKANLINVQMVLDKKN